MINYDDYLVMNMMNHGIYEYKKHYIRAYVYSHQISAKSAQQHKSYMHKIENLARGAERKSRVHDFEENSLVGWTFSLHSLDTTMEIIKMVRRERYNSRGTGRI